MKTHTVIAADGKKYPLTMKQERFARECVIQTNATDAYKIAYDSENMLDKTICVEASRLLNNPNVTTLINDLKAELREKNAVSVETITQELEKARECAEEQSNAAGQVAASMGKAKLHGLLVDKRQEVIKSKLEQLTDKEVDNLLTEYLARKEGTGESQ